MFPSRDLDTSSKRHHAKNKFTSWCLPQEGCDTIFANTDPNRVPIRNVRAFLYLNVCGTLSPDSRVLKQNFYRLMFSFSSGVLENGESSWTRQVIARSGSALLHFFSDDAYAMEGFNVTYSAYSCPSNDHRTNCSSEYWIDEWYRELSETHCATCCGSILAWDKYLIT